MTQDPTPDRESRSNQSEQGYEAPSVEEIDTEDAPAVTAAGDDCNGGGSDLRWKRSVRPLDEAIVKPR